MEKIIALYKTLERPTDAKIYLANLETVVKDLFSTPFHGDVRLYHGEKHLASYYDVYYGKKNVRDKSGAPKEKSIWEIDARINTLKQLRAHLKKTKKIENPDFTIQYKDIKSIEAKTSYDRLFGPSTENKRHGSHNRIEMIDLHKYNSSTYVHLRLFDDGLVEIKFRYDTESFSKEIQRINRGVTNLQNRDYNLPHELLQRVNV